MTTIALEKEWIETAQLFGDVKSIITEAVRAYAIQQCQQRLEEAKAKVAVYRRKYNYDYATFKHAIQVDESFLTTIESQNPMWEQDAMEWEYWLEEQQAWRDQLETIMRR
jgi:hypothetical protein